MTVPVIAAGLLFACSPVAVGDGDGPIWCSEGPRLRIAHIAAREMDGSCRRGHPCPAASATEARDALVQLLGGARSIASTGHVVVRGATLRCRSLGHAKGGRTAAMCRLATGEDLGEMMIRTGTVSRWDR